MLRGLRAWIYFVETGREITAHPLSNLHHGESTTGRQDWQYVSRGSGRILITDILLISAGRCCFASSPNDGRYGSRHVRDRGFTELQSGGMSKVSAIRSVQALPEMADISWQLPTGDIHQQGGLPQISRGYLPFTRLQIPVV